MAMLDRLFKPRPAKAAGAILYAAAVAQARRPEFYRVLGVEDRIDARFELYTLHVLLLTRRLAGQGEQAVETAQALFDHFLSALDHTLREIGVGDLSVAKKMRKLGEAVYGRGKAYEAALGPAPERRTLEELLNRTVWGEEEGAERAAPLADYVMAAVGSLEAQPLGEILAGRPAWPDPAAYAQPKTESDT
jgi:cytochrome b pre-mRNA-processing protein 3